jgi:hypothetical protein
MNPLIEQLKKYGPLSPEAQNDIEQKTKKNNQKEE